MTEESFIVCFLMVVFPAFLFGNIKFLLPHRRGVATPPDCCILEPRRRWNQPENNQKGQKHMNNMDNLEVQDAQEYADSVNDNGQSAGNIDNAADSAAEKETEKKYTDEDVNDIVKKRLARERKKFGEPDEYIKEIEEREGKVLERELKLEARERYKKFTWADRVEFPEVALELLDYSSKEAFDKSFELFGELGRQIYVGFMDRYAAYGTPKGGSGNMRPDATRDAFFGNKQHTPKNR